MSATAASPIPTWNIGVNPRTSHRSSVGTWTSASTRRYAPSVFTFNANWAPGPLRLSINGTRASFSVSGWGERSSSALGPVSPVMSDEVERVSHLDLDFDSDGDSDSEHEDEGEQHVVDGDSDSDRGGDGNNKEEETGSLNGALRAYLASYGFPDGLGYERPPPALSSPSQYSESNADGVNSDADEEARLPGNSTVGYTSPGSVLPTGRSVASAVLLTFGGEVDTVLIDDPGRAWEGVCWDEAAPGSDSDSEEDERYSSEEENDVRTISNGTEIEEWLSLTGARAQAARATIIPLPLPPPPVDPPPPAPHYGASGRDRLVTLTVTSERDRDPPPYDVAYESGLADHHTPPRARSQLSFPTSPTSTDTTIPAAESRATDSASTHFSALFPHPPHSASARLTGDCITAPPHPISDTSTPTPTECASSPPHFPFHLQSHSISSTPRRPLPPRPVTSNASIGAVGGPRPTAEAWLNTSAAGPYASGRPSGTGPTHTLYSCLDPSLGPSPALSDSGLGSAHSEFRSESHFGTSHDQTAADSVPNHILHHPTLLSSTPALSSLSEESTDSFVKLDVFTADMSPKQSLDSYKSSSETAFQHVIPSSMIFTSSAVGGAGGGIGLQPMPAPRKPGRRTGRSGTGSAKPLQRLATRCSTLTRRIGIGVGAGSGSARER